VGDLENTYCHNCRATLIERYGYLITGYHLTAEGACPKCGTSIPGRWAKEFQGQITDRPFLPRSRSLISILSS
jgi:pyruvate formate lyase activating enzyme